MPPYLKTPIAPSKKFTLVLDLDETLLHYMEKPEDPQEGQLHIRPGAEEFLDTLSQHYEIVIFTAAMQDYADWALEHLSNRGCIAHRLYRQHAIPSASGFYVKDLSRIGRDLARTIIVDNIAENFQLQPENGIFIKSWFTDARDTALFELAPLLVAIAQSPVSDVRETLKLFRSYMLEQMARGVANPTLHLAQNIRHLLDKHYSRNGPKSR
jgi:CTD small phosphatase-like protein 2